MGSNTNAPIIIAIFTFYIFIFGLLGLINDSIDTGYEASTLEEPTVPTTEELSIFGLIIGIPTFIFSVISIIFQGMLFTITGIPYIFTLLLFAPLTITIFYIGVSFIRGSS